MTIPYNIPIPAPAAPEFTVEELLNQKVAQSPGLMQMLQRPAPTEEQMAAIGERAGLQMPAAGGVIRGNVAPIGSAMMAAPPPPQVNVPNIDVPQVALPGQVQTAPPVAAPNGQQGQVPSAPQMGAPAQPQAQRGLLGSIAHTGGRGLARLFGTGQGLGPEEASRQGWRGLTDFGLSMMAGAGPAPWGQPHDSMGQAIAKGVMAGREGYASRAGAARRRGWQQEVAERMKGKGFGEMQPGEWDRLMVEAMEYAPDLVTSLSEVRKSLAQQGSQGATRPFEIESLDEEGNPITELISPTGETIATRPREASAAAMTPPKTITLRNAEGKRTLHQWDGQQQAWIDTGRDPGTIMSDAQGKAASFIPLIMANKDILDEFVDKRPVLLNEIASENRVTRAAAGELAQQMKLSGNVFAEAWLRQTTGAAYNSEELANAYSLFVPTATDELATLKRKQLNRDMLEMMLDIRADGRRMTDEEEQYVADLTKNVQTAGGAEIRRKLRNGEELTAAERATLASGRSVITLLPRSSFSDRIEGTYREEEN